VRLVGVPESVADEKLDASARGFRRPRSHTRSGGEVSFHATARARTPRRRAEIAPYAAPSTTRSDLGVGEGDATLESSLARG